MTEPEKIYSSKHIVFTSEQSLDQDPTNFRINFRNSIFTNGHVIGILPVDIWIPNLFYNVVEGNRNVTLVEFDVNVYVIDMPLGHYTVDEWCAEFTAQVLAIGTVAKVVSCGVNSITGVLSIVFDGPIDYFPVLSTANDLLGVKGTDPILGANTITFTDPVAFQGVQTVLVETGISKGNCCIGNNDRHLTLMDVVSLSEVCYGETKHHFVRTDNVREFPISANDPISTIRMTLLDTDAQPLILPCNAKVVYHFLVSFGPNN